MWMTYPRFCWNACWLMDSGTFAFSWQQAILQISQSTIQCAVRAARHASSVGSKHCSVYQRSVWCTEKVHSIKHCGENYREAGQCKNYTIQTLETRHKSALKTVAHKTNTQASVGGSVLQANLQLEASGELTRQIDRKGAHLAHFCMHTVHTLHTTVCILCIPCTLF